MYYCSQRRRGDYLIQKQKPLIVVADILMQGTDGYELCRQIKTDKETQKIPVVLLTQLSEPKEILSGLESGKPYDAVIMDLTVPGGMGGAEAIKRLHEIDPAVKAIVSSGYSKDLIISEYKEHGFTDYIAKPYRFTELSKIMNRVITGRSV